MSPEETPEEKPKRRRSRKKAEDASTSEAPGVQSETPSEATSARGASDADAPSPSAEAEAPDEIEPTPADEEAEEATEVVLEADDEAEEEPEAEAEEEPEAEADAAAAKPARRRRRRGAEASEEKPAAPAKPAPSRRRRSQRDPNLPPPVVRAQAKYVRSSARKARLVCDHIRGKTVEEARAILALTPRAVARDWSKLLESAVANAEHNHELVGEDLYVKAVHADEGPTIKRFRPRAMGRATRIRKRTSHLTILLTPKE
jgi:ribosomal protein L22